MFMKLLLADPHPQVRSALHLVLSQIPNVTVIGESGDAFQLVSLCSQECPDLILLDPELVRRNDCQPLVDIITNTNKIKKAARPAITKRLLPTSVHNKARLNL